MSMNTRGFTLIETLVAITILVTAIAGPLTIASKGLTSAILGRDQFIASFLAQEGIEFIRQKRDTNSLANPSSNWLTGLDLCTAGNCMVDPKNDAISACPSGTCSALRRDTTGFYTYDLTGVETPFTRTVRVTPNANGYEATVTSVVSWRTGPFSRQVSVEENMFDWQ